MILQWLEKVPDGCALHPTSDIHKFLEYHHVCNCTECNAVDDLATAIVSRKRGDPAGANTQARRLALTEDLDALVKAKRAQMGGIKQIVMLKTLRRNMTVLAHIRQLVPITIIMQTYNLIQCL